MTIIMDILTNNLYYLRNGMQTPPNSKPITKPDTAVSTESPATTDANTANSIRAKISAGADQPPSAALADLISTFEMAKQKGK